MSFSALDVPFGPLDTKTDERMLPNGALLLAENCSSQTVGGYRKRNGYDQLTNPGNVLRLASRGNQLLTVGPSGTLQGFDNVSAWRSIGFGNFLGLPDAQTSQTTLELDQSNDVTKGTRCTINGVTMHAFVRFGFLWVRLVDTASGAVFFENSVDSGTFFSIHAVSAGTQIGLVYSKSSQEVKGVTISTSTRTVAAAVVIVNGAAVNAVSQYMDMCPLNSTDALLVWYSNTPDIRVSRLTISTMTNAAGPTVMSAEVANSGIAIVGTTGEFGAILYQGTAAGGMRAACFNPATTAQTVAPFMVEAVVAPAASNCGLIRVDSTHVLAVWDRAATGITKQKVQWTQLSSAGVVSALCGPLFNCALASKPFDGDVATYGSASKAFNVWAPYTAQFTYFTVRVATVSGGPSCFPTAMHAYRTAYRSAQISGQLTDVDVLSSSSYAFSASIGYKFLSTSSERAGWATFGVDYRAATLFKWVECIGDTIFAAGLVGKTDGSATSEVNFPLYPEITQATPGAGGAGGMDNGTYSYIAIFEASDGAGNTDRSTSSIAVSATTAAGAGLGKVTLTIDHLAITRIAQASSTTGTISIFRTVASGTTYRFIGTISMSPAAASGTYTDQAHDSTITSNRLLYTQPGATSQSLDREPPPAATQIILHKGRVWGISSADKRVLFYSGKLIPGEGVWFSSAQQIRVEAGGDCVGLASMDDKMVVFKSDRVFKIYGDGPNALGTSGEFSDPVLMNGDAGCVDPRSLLSTDQGTFFLSDKGLYQVSRGEEISYRGEGADTYWANSTNIAAACMMPDRQEVRFEVYGGSGVGGVASQKLVLNYATNQWTTHRNYQDRTAVDAVVVNGSYYWADSNGVVLKENATFVDPSSTFVVMKIQTGWIKPAGFQGWVRAQRTNLLANRKTDHSLTLACENDYVSGTTTATKTWTAAQIAALPREQVNLHLVRQKGEAYRYTITDGADGTLGTGEGSHWFGLQLYAQALRGTFEKKLLAAARG